jgi:sterol desaturase/sphingolipid hydroxylase (fatty acid hydroxylase superfamily)
MAAFTGVILAMVLAERLFPRRRLAVSKPLRWWNNLGLFALNTFVARLLLPIGAVGVAHLAEQYRWGLFNQIDLPAWLAVLLAFVLLDFAIYLQHVLFHAIPALWQLHRVHHADLDFDASTGVRFHPLEIVLSLGIKLVVVCLLGAPVWSVLVFEIMLNASSLFNHANVRLPSWLDRVLRLFLVTPDMHRVHHSIDPRETNTNFGFNLPWWDYLLGTYLDQPKKGHEAMTIGLADVRDEAHAQRIGWLLLLPFGNWLDRAKKHEHVT